MSEKKELQSRHLSYAYLREDGVVWYIDCPKCHFFKNSPSDVGNPCRNAMCPDGVVVLVEVSTERAWDEGYAAGNAFGHEWAQDTYDGPAEDSTTNPYALPDNGCDGNCPESRT